MSKQPVEAEVLADVYDQAMARARSQGQRLATVARQIMFQEAAKTPEGTPVPEGRPPLRQYGQPRKTIKFSVDADAHRSASDRILASGRSVAAAIEDGLRIYARTGTLPALAVDDAEATERANREAELIRQHNP